MINAEVLTSAGYRKYPVPKIIMNCDVLWSKTFKNGRAHLYAIHIGEYYPRYTDITGYAPQTQMRLADDTYFNLEMLGCNQFSDIAHVEMFFQQAYERFECIPVEEG